MEKITNTKTTNTKNAAQAFSIQKPAPAHSASSPSGQILYLQRTIGNQAVQRLFKSGLIQAKLKIGQPNDVYEQEADRVADMVMRMPVETVVSNQLSVIRKENNDNIQMKPG